MRVLRCLPVICCLSILVGFFVVQASPQDYGVELLVYDKDHWMDGLTPGQRKTKGISDEEYDARDQRGDIIEIHEYPYYSRFGPEHWGGHAFRVIVVKGITIEQAKALRLGQRISPTGKRARRIANAKAAEVETVNNITDLIIEARQ
jgi:hypothetical protein